MGEYVVEEVKKVKVNLSAFELLRVPMIRSVVLGSLGENISLKSSQDATIKKVGFSEPVVKEMIGKNHSSQPARHLVNQLEKDKVQAQPEDKGK